MINAESIWSDVEKIRENAPLVHNITNYVVMNNTANALLAIGASPVMAHASEEVADMVNIASALVINIGTLSEKWVEAMQKAMFQAKSRGKPVIFDPVGAGATPYRTETVHQLISSTAPTIIRGNASEIKAIVAAEVKTKGVDSTVAAASAIEAAQKLNEMYGATVVISGEKDFIVDAVQVFEVSNGHRLMPRVTGLGCTASALCGAFATVNDSPLLAAAHAMAVMGIAGELAGERAEGPGTLQVYFLDKLHTLTESDIAARLKAEVRT